MYWFFYFKTIQVPSVKLLCVDGGCDSSGCGGCAGDGPGKEVIEFSCAGFVGRDCWFVGCKIN